MARVYFWNAEHLSTRAQMIADERDALTERAAAAESEQLRQAARHGRGGSKAVTRSMVGAGARRMANEPYARLVYSDDRTEQRQIEQEVAHRQRARRLEYRAGVARRKCDTQDWLEARPDPLFYCEVQQAFPGSDSSLRDAGAAGAATLCYWTNIGGGLAEPAGFPAAGPGVPGPPAGPHLTEAGARIPKYADGGGGVNLFFWHAPSGNSGEVVAAMWNFIQATYAGQNILFGDLNCEPGQLLALGVPLGEIAAPVGPTRISGRTLDYALTSFQPVFVFRAFDQATAHGLIKQRFGSDHAAMCLRW